MKDGSKPRPSGAKRSPSRAGGSRRSPCAGCGAPLRRLSTVAFTPDILADARLALPDEAFEGVPEPVAADSDGQVGKICRGLTFEILLGSRV